MHTRHLFLFCQLSADYYGRIFLKNKITGILKFSTVSFSLKELQKVPDSNFAENRRFFCLCSGTAFATGERGSCSSLRKKIIETAATVVAAG